MPAAIDHDERLMEVVSLALQRAPADREACLRSLCGNDVELFQEASQMVKEEEQMGSFLLQPMIAFQEAVHPFRTGQIIAGRFEILRELGEGGMGIVYEAFDRKRRLRIAIKAAKPGFHRLLSPELEGALTVRHPNVCRVNEIHVAQTEFGDIDFLTMELLEGQTLSAYLKARGKLPEPEALLIARQLCEGISEAHRNGIIHRDLKSANIFLCDSPEGKTRVVITDFGLSGAPSERDDLAGTPEYMAPELWAGSKTSKASDIYALGVVLYQMVADPRLEQRSSCDPWLPDTKGLSKSWIKTLNCCVDPSPEARPNDASQVLAGLQARPSAWRFVLALPLAALIALAIPDTRTRLHDGIWPPPLVRLMVLPASGSPLAPDFNAGVLQDVSNRLSHMTSGSRLVQVIPPGEAKNIQVQTPEQAREARATHALKTSIRREGADFLVEGSLSDVKTQTVITHFARRYSPATSGVISGAITGTVSGSLGLHRGGQSETVSASATKLYDQGLQLSSERIQRFADAASLFREAARLDPLSPLPLTALVEAEVKEFSVSKSSSLLALAQKDLQAAENLNPDSLSVHLSAGRLAEATGDYEKAQSHYLRINELEPQNMRALIHLALVYDKLNLPEKAIETYQAAIRLDPASYLPYDYLGVFYYFRGQYSEAAEQFKKAVQRAPKLDRAYSNLAASLQNMGRNVEAEQAYRTSLKLRESATGLCNLGTLLALQKRDREAVPYYERAIALNPKEYLYRLNLADSYRRLGRHNHSSVEYRRGMNLARAELKENPRSAYVRAIVAYCAARLQLATRAEDEMKQALRLSSGDNRVIRFAVATYDTLGLRELALAAVANATPQVLREISRDPDLELFSEDPLFKELLAKNLNGDQ